MIAGMHGYHCIFRRADGGALATTPARRRELARTLYRIGGPFDLLAFRCSGDHLHAAVGCERREVGRFAQAAGSALSQRLDLDHGFAPTTLRPFEDQRHLTTAFHYVLRNADKHGLADDPMHDASSLPELLGLRVLDNAVIGRVRASLPKTTRQELLSHLGVSRLEPAFVAAWLADAAAGALGLADLDGRDDRSTRARAAAVRVAGPHLRTAAIVEALGLPGRTVQRLRTTAPETLLDNAVALRMGLRAELGARAEAETPL